MTSIGVSARINPGSSIGVAGLEEDRLNFLNSVKPLDERTLLIGGLSFAISFFFSTLHSVSSASSNIPPSSSLKLRLDALDNCETKLLQLGICLKVGLAGETFDLIGLSGGVVWEGFEDSAEELEEGCAR
jgi:hypothetical protein